MARLLACGDEMCLDVLLGTKMQMPTDFTPGQGSAVKMKSVTWKDGTLISEQERQKISSDPRVLRQFMKQFKNRLHTLLPVDVIR